MGRRRCESPPEAARPIPGGSLPKSDPDHWRSSPARIDNSARDGNVRRVQAGGNSRAKSGHPGHRKYPSLTGHSTNRVGSVAARIAVAVAKCDVSDQLLPVVHIEQHPEFAPDTTCRRLEALPYERTNILDAIQGIMSAQYELITVEMCLSMQCQPGFPRQQ